MKPLHRALKDYGAGYPEAYLLARLKPRLLSFYTQDKPAGVRGHRECYQSIAWSYRQLPRGIRRDFSRLYLYLQLPLLVDAVRYISAGLTQNAQRILAQSLWGRMILNSLTAQHGNQHLIESLCSQLIDFGWEIQFCDTEDPASSIQDLERALYAFILTPDKGGPVIVKEILAVLRDLYNLTLSITHEVQPAPESFLSSGRIDVTDITGSAGPHRAISAHFAPLPPGNDPIMHICQAYSSELFRKTRNNSIDFCLTAYLWQQSMHVRQTAIDKTPTRNAA